MLFYVQPPPTATTASVDSFNNRLTSSFCFVLERLMFRNGKYNSILRSHCLEIISEWCQRRIGLHGDEGYYYDHPLKHISVLPNGGNWSPDMRHRNG
mmetsp:Transcript_10732/g.31295  ORF Transcript_10732/g.31295 Transcript_10732/m.31295 type:complete len:97 (-) Transcript_10732:1242-1532(-)